MAFPKLFDATLTQLLILSGVVGDEEEEKRFPVGDKCAVNDLLAIDWALVNWPIVDWLMLDWLVVDWTAV